MTTPTATDPANSIRFSDPSPPASSSAAFEIDEDLPRLPSLPPIIDPKLLGVDGLVDALATAAAARNEATADLPAAKRRIAESMKLSSAHDITAAWHRDGEQRAASLCAPAARVVTLLHGAIAKSVTERDEHAPLGVEMCAPPPTPNPLRELPGAPAFVDPPPFVSMDAALRLDRMRGALLDLLARSANVELTRILATAAASADASVIVALETLPSVQRDAILASLVRGGGKIDVLDVLRRTYWRSRHPQHFARFDGLQLLAKTVGGSLRSASNKIRSDLGGGLSILDDVQRTLAPLNLPLSGRPLA